MRPTLCLLVLVGLGLPVLVPGRAAEGPAPRPAPVEQLIQQLGHRDFPVREAAWEKIRALGVEALPALRQARQNQTDPEILRRLEELIPLLERAAWLAPKQVTLRLTDRPIQEAVAELSRQTGYALEFPKGGPDQNSRHSFQLEGVTFWEAL